MRIRSHLFVLYGLAMCLFIFSVFVPPAQAQMPSTAYQMNDNFRKRVTGGPGSITEAAFESFQQVEDAQPMPQYPSGGPLNQGPQAGLNSLQQSNVENQLKKDQTPGSTQVGCDTCFSAYQNAAANMDGAGKKTGQEWRVYNEGGSEKFTANMPTKMLQNALEAHISSYGDNNVMLPAESQSMLSNSLIADSVNRIAENNPLQKMSEGKNDVGGLAQGASNTLADAFDPTWLQMLRLQNEGLLNVANEATGSPTSSLAVTKTHRNAVWFVQRMYQEVYIPMAILLILPGAVLTQMKGLVSFGVLSSTNDEDAVSPFSGILRGMIALFLIPATQLICSYTIDVGNSLHHEVKQHVDPGLIFRWADEQVFKPGTEQNAILDPMMFPVLGKMSQGLEAASGMEAQSTATAMLQTLANGMADSAAFGLVMLCAFQITMICYLLCMGPIAAAFYAWPSGMGSLFNRIFSAWLDSIINIALWKFWWTIVLLCITVRLNWIGNPAGWVDEWELLMFIAFMVILTYVPFNPFDYKAGEMVSKVMQLADSAVNDASKG